MKKHTLLLASLLSFSLSVQAESVSVKKESSISKVKSSSAQTSKARQTFPLKQDGQIRIERKTLERKTRQSQELATAKSNVANGEGKLRQSTPKSSQKASDFVIYDAWVTLDNDFDGDGYYSDFTVSFDADVTAGSATVYAEIFISKNGIDWVFLDDTNDFVIVGQEEDQYSISFSLLNSYPTDQYDILIDLYESGYDGIVATAEPSNDSDLFALPLEDAGYDGNTQITYMASQLSSDYDLDGFYSKLTLEYDIDTVDVGRAVVVEIDLIDATSGYRKQVTSLDFTLGNQTEFVELFFENGISPDWYDVELRVMDYYTNEEITYAAYDGFSSLRELPIESDNFDYVEEVDVVVVHSGGGSFGGFLLGLSVFGIIALRRKK